MPETTVGAIIAQQKDTGTRILLTRRGHEPFAGRWCLPGGHIDAYEPARAAIAREIHEETGLRFDPQFWAYFDEIIPQHGLHACVLVFEGPWTGELQAQTAEVTEMGWFSLDEAQRLPLAFTHNEIVAAYAARFA